MRERSEAPSIGLAGRVVKFVVAGRTRDIFGMDTKEDCSETEEAHYKFTLRTDDVVRRLH